jgi:NTE family protein
MSDNAIKPHKSKCILVLQGGGAMGAYHIGAFQALREQAFEPDWVCGISMGAINGAIIAGNAPERRLEKLETFWDTISWPSSMPAIGDVRFDTLEHRLSFATTALLGQPGFFTPRIVNPYFAAPGLAATSFYDTTPLCETLAATVDFNRLNANVTRLSVGATDIEAGTLIFFDTQKKLGRFGPEHVVASGSLPPGFPPTPIDGKFYWDGGCVSNSPLEAVQRDMPPDHTVIFIIDLWCAKGPAPDTMEAVAWRSKQIRFASATPQHVEAMASKINLRHAMQLLNGAKADLSGQRIDLVHIVYHPGQDEIASSDAEFSRASIGERRKAGLADMRRALEESPWLRVPKPEHVGCMVHRVTRDGVKTLDCSQ